MISSLIILSCIILLNIIKRMRLINESDREATLVKLINGDTVVSCRMPRLQASGLPQASLRCLIDVSVKGDEQQQRSKYLEYKIFSQLASSVEVEAYPGCSLKLVVFIHSEGRRLEAGLLNCCVAALLLSGIAMRQTPFATESGQNRLLYDLVSGDVLSGTIKDTVDKKEVEEEIKKHRDSLKEWLGEQVSN